jgi:hypothetical protein
MSRRRLLWDEDYDCGVCHDSGVIIYFDEEFRRREEFACESCETDEPSMEWYMKKPRTEIRGSSNKRE